MSNMAGTLVADWASLVYRDAAMLWFGGMVRKSELVVRETGGNGVIALAAGSPDQWCSSWSWHALQLRVCWAANSGSYTKLT